MTKMEIESAVAETQEYMNNNYPSWNTSKGEQLARFFYDAVDKEGMIIPFNLTWEMAGFANKASAKRILVGDRGKLNLVEGQDYKIVHFLDKTLLVKKDKSETRRQNGGDRRSEDIFLTCSAFRKFLLASVNTNDWIIPYVDRLWFESNKYAKNDKNAMYRRLKIEHKRIDDVIQHQLKVSEHDKIKNDLSTRLNGTTEVQNTYGAADIETEKEVIEVKPVRDYKHALGQIIFYSIATNKRPRVHLYGGKLKEEEEAVFKKLKVHLTYDKKKKK